MWGELVGVIGNLELESVCRNQMLGMIFRACVLGKEGRKELGILGIVIVTCAARQKVDLGLKNSVSLFAGSVLSKLLLKPFHFSLSLFRPQPCLSPIPNSTSLPVWSSRRVVKF